MAKKKTVSQKTVSQKPVSEPTQEAADDAAKPTATDSLTPAKSKPRVGDEPSSDGGVGIADIKKACVFVMATTAVLQNSLA